MRIKVLGDCQTAVALRGNLAKAGFRISNSVGMNGLGYTIFIQEYGGVYIHIDGIDCELERNMINGIAGLTETPILLQRAGGVQNDREIRIRVTQNDDDQKAVELGIVRGLLLTVGLERGIAKHVKPPKASTVGLAIMVLAALMLFSLGLKGQQLSNTVTRLFSGTPTNPCTAFQLAKDSSTGHLWSCNQATLMWVDIGPATGGGTVTAVTGTPPIASSGGATPDISISQSGVATNGYLSSTDWGTFNSKQAALSSNTCSAGDFFNGFTAPNTFSCATPSGASFPRLDQVLDPTASKTFTMGANNLTFSWPTYELSHTATGTTFGNGADFTWIFNGLSAVKPRIATIAPWGATGLGILFVTSTINNTDTSGALIDMNMYQDSTNGDIPTGPSILQVFGVFKGNNDFSGGAAIAAGATEDDSNTTPISTWSDFMTAGNSFSHEIQTYKGFDLFTVPQCVTCYGVFLSDVNVGTTNYAIKTGLGAVDFGDTVKGASTINAVTGFQVNGAATLANVLRGDGTNFVDASLSCADLSDDGSLCASSGPLPSNEAGAANNFLTAYNSGTGAFSKAQPSCGNLSDAGTGCTGAAYPGLVAHNLLSVSHGDTVAASPVLGDMLYGNVTPAWTKLAGNTTAVKQWLSQTGTGAVSAVPAWSDVKLDEVSNPSGNKTFTMANKSLQFTFTNPSNAPTYDGAFEIEATGAFTGDLVHIHQHTGNPGAGTDAVHIEAADADVTPLRIVSASTIGLTSNKPLESTIATGTAPLIVSSTTEVANLRSATSTALAGDPTDCGANTLANAIAASGNLTCRAVVEADISLSDNTTDDVSTTKHGFVPKGTNTGKFLRDDGTWQTVSASLPSGLIVFIASGTCPAGFTEVAGLSGKFVLGTTAAGGDVGTTGGSSSYTPAGTNAASAVSGIVVDAHASHTHDYTQVPNHVHPENGPNSASGGALTLGIDTNASGNQATGSNTANPTGGVATATTVGPNAALTHNVSNNGTAAAQAFTGTPATITPPYIKLIGCSSN